MIQLSTLVRTEGHGLSLQNNVLTIHKSMTEYVWIDRGLTVILEPNVSAKLLDVCTNQTIHIIIKDGAQLAYQILNSKNCNRWIECFGEIEVTQICLEESREQLEVALLKEQAKAEVQLLSIASQYTQKLNQKIEHKAKYTSSNISNFGVAMQNGEILFDTTGQIQKGMAKSKCVQLSKGIVMDDCSSVTSKPILLIDEYDVVANHGASIGKMSDESLFYLMSRGLTKQEAFLLILEGIVGPFIEKVADEELKEKINQRIEQIIKR